MADEGKAVVRAVRGSAQYSAGKKWRPLKKEQILKVGDKVRVDANSQVDIFLAKNGSVVRVTELTTLEIERLTVATDGTNSVTETQLSLPSGRIMGHIYRPVTNSFYRVRIPLGVVQLPGGEFDLTASGRLQLISGSYAATVTLTNGQVTFFKPYLGD